ncbi:hypothetical protein E2C01_015812 [Portunus trituberculatus]|uniref:Uncharacterized protein n=1 Tax=Portunus trituberculatus TaxID=210409 RepID=A0A5B7DPD2_PORTR|nr:hypothetical protein [Portunus trituberculatus]
MLYRYPVRVCGVDPCEVGELEVNCRYQVGEEVWVKPPNAQCNEHHKKGTIANVISEQTVEVHGVPRHVKDLHHVTSHQPASETTATRSDGEELLVELRIQADTGDEMRLTRRTKRKRKSKSQPSVCC